MYNSILHFIEEDIKNIEKDLGKILTGETDADHLNGAAANIIEEAIDSSYRKGGINASKTTPASKQATKRLIHNTQIHMPLEKVKEKNPQIQDTN